MAKKRTYLVNAAPPDAVQEFAHGLTDEFLQCRELGHLWRPHTASLAKGYYERRLRCPRCKTIREEQISLTGEVLRRHMIYADGYLAQHMGRIVGNGRGLLRLESITRTVAHTDELTQRRAARTGA